MEIRKSHDSDRLNIQQIHTEAFGRIKGPEIANLVNGLFEDKTAEPRLSLVALEKGELTGHILFSKVTLLKSPHPVSASILAPLAVLPGSQSAGVGKALIKEGLFQLKQAGVDLVFVLGHPDYYPHSGFTPAGVLGFEAPYPIPKKDAGAWMVTALFPDVLGRAKGRVRCAQVLNRPEHWRE